MSLKLPCVLGGRYEVRERIGSGGMGEVYVAGQLGLARDVAIKLLSAGIAGDREQSARIKERFRREAVALSRLRHPNTVQLIDFGLTDDQRPYIVTELLTGTTLDVVLHREGPFDAERSLHVMLQICKSLAESHLHGIVHRDLKPSNVFLIEAAHTRDFVKVIDFGVARVDAVEENAKARPLTVEGTTLGTPDYMAPEQARGHTPTPATDVYALGCILYEMLAGRPPFTGESAIQVMIKQIKEEPPPISSIRPELFLPPGLEHAVMLAMRKKATDRPADAGVLVEMLSEIRVVAQPPVLQDLGGLSDLSGFSGVPGFQDEAADHQNATQRQGDRRRAAPSFGEDSHLFRVRVGGAEPAEEASSTGKFRRPISLKRPKAAGRSDARGDEAEATPAPDSDWPADGALDVNPGPNAEPLDPTPATEAELPSVVVSADMAPPAAPLPAAPSPARRRRGPPPGDSEAFATTRPEGIPQDTSEAPAAPDPQRTLLVDAIRPEDDGRQELHGPTSASRWWWLVPALLAALAAIAAGGFFLWRALGG